MEESSALSDSNQLPRVRACVHACMFVCVCAWCVCLLSEEGALITLLAFSLPAWVPTFPEEKDKCDRGDREEEVSDF